MKTQPTKRIAIIAAEEALSFWKSRGAELKAEAQSLWNRRDVLIDARCDTNDVDAQKELQADIDQHALAAYIVEVYAHRAYDQREKVYGVSALSI